jgi:endonuclease/exonuclease/phosphatase family metal-dependent hydrolase
MLVLGCGACDDDGNGDPPRDATTVDAGVDGAVDATLDTAVDGAPFGDPLTVITFNAGLPRGDIPSVDQRLPLTIAALEASGADVICLQEVWADADFETLSQEIQDTYPHIFREKTEDPKNGAAGRCPDADAVLAMQGCVEDNCTSQQIPASDCVSEGGACQAAYEALPSDCRLCLAANAEGSEPIKCLIGASRLYWGDGRNGLVLLSKQAMTGAKYNSFTDTVFFERGAITATIAGKTVQCTHTSTALGFLPYAEGRTHDSYKAENLAQMSELAGLASGCTILMGDLNTGPAATGVDAEWPENYQALFALGYEESWDTPACTFCADNPLLGSGKSKWIDHILLKGCAPVSITRSRVLDEAQTIEVDEQSITTRLSDHYGLKAVIAPAGS